MSLTHLRWLGFLFSVIRFELMVFLLLTRDSLNHSGCLTVVGSLGYYGCLSADDSLLVFGFLR